MHEPPETFRLLFEAFMFMFTGMISLYIAGVLSRKTFMLLFAGLMALVVLYLASI